jgi:hypothetical protein
MRTILLSLLWRLGLGLLFGLAGCDGHSGYRKVDGRWAHNGDAFTPEDAASFKPLDALFARDARRGYYRGSAVDGSDGASFEALSEHEARDRLAVYYCDTFRKGQEYWTVQHLRIGRIRDADPATYRVLGQGYARDAQRVYVDGVPFSVRDVASFEPLAGDFARDAQRGYYARLEIPGSHGPSFASIDPRDPDYARDRAHVYHGHREVNTPNQGPHPVLRIVRQADPATLRVLGRGYASDATHVWHRGELVTGVDAASFQVDESYVGDADARDRLGPWSAGRRITPAAPAAAAAKAS